MSHFSSRKWRMLSTAKPVATGLAVLVTVLVAILALGLQSAEATSSTELDQQLRDLRAELEDVRANLKKAEAARETALGDLAALDQSLDYAQRAYELAHRAYAEAAEHLAELQEELAELMAQLQSNQQEFEKTQRYLAEQQETLCERMVSLYKAGGAMDYLAAFVGDEDDSLVDVIDRIRLLSTIAEQDARLLTRISDLKDRIVEQRRALEQERTRVSELEAHQAAITDELQAADRECKTSLDEAEAARAAKKTALASIEKSKSAWTRQEDQLLADSGRIEALLKNTRTSTPTKPGKGVLSRPVPGAVTSGFGYRIHPIFKVRKLHTGVDFQGSTGEPIKAAAAGTVIFAGWRGGYGKCVVIDHGGGLATLCAHQSVISVSVGQVVKRGTVIGKVGSTGYSTGPHLHFEVRVNGSPVDPMDYL